MTRSDLGESDLTTGDVVTLESSQSTGVDRASTPRGVAAMLRDMAADLRAFRSGVFPPSGILLRVLAEGLETAASQITESCTKTQYMHLLDREREKVAALETERDELRDRLETEESHTASLRRRIEDLRATCEGLRRDLDEAEGALTEHRGTDFAALRMAQRAQS